MKQLKIGTIPLPKIYIIGPKDTADKQTCRELGIPYIIKPAEWSDDKLIKAVLWQTLYKKFPRIRWDRMFGFSKPDLSIFVPEQGEIEEVSSDYRINPGFDTCGRTDASMEQSDDYRFTGGGFEDDGSFEEIQYTQTNIDKYIGDLGWYVNIEELQALKILPTFLDDIATAVKRNLSNTAWVDGYNKKLGYPAGNYLSGSDAPNLIILDTSGSIPCGVAGTMVSLIDTLRHQANADLIITSGRSKYYPANTQLPTPDELSYLIGGCNECWQFYEILRKHILGKHWGNVIVFGDQDAPNDMRFKYWDDCWIKETELQSTKIDRIMAFHTYAEKIPGYGLWAKEAAPNAEVIYNNVWVQSM